MKKTLLLLIVFSILFTLVACGNKMPKAEKYCWSCGEGVTKQAAFCEHCGVSLKGISTEASSDGGSTETTQILTDESTSAETTQTSAGESSSIPTEEPTSAVTDETTAAPTVENTAPPTQAPSSPSNICNHSWKDATCTTPKTCSKCGIIEGSALEHSYTKFDTTPTCTEKGYSFYICSCGVNYFDNYTEALGHSWKDATCIAPKTCNTCHITEGIALAHNWINASCAAPKTCSNCGVTEGSSLPHDMSVATCTAVPTCKVCGYKDGDFADHNFARSPTNCTEYFCAECGKKEISGEHDFWFTSCTTPGKCTYCGITDGKIPGHRFKNGTCTACKASENKE